MKKINEEHVIIADFILIPAIFMFILPYSIRLFNLNFTTYPIIYGATIIAYTLVTYLIFFLIEIKNQKIKENDKNEHNNNK